MSALNYENGCVMVGQPDQSAARKPHLLLHVTLCLNHKVLQPTMVHDDNDVHCCPLVTHSIGKCNIPKACGSLHKRDVRPVQ